ncbi:hypothetical protein [Nocardia sp. CA-120079]|uniref:hypothetical protein n=1 Tax=Nocardia sp. CA-120079 TaxID=3239974 RepID=UPI003D97E895
MSSDKQTSHVVHSLTIYQVFQELDGHLADTAEEYRYDVESGLVKLQNTIAGFTAARREQDERAARRHHEVTAAFETRRNLIKGPTAAARQQIVAERVAGLNISPLKITSTTSPETALRMGDAATGEERWSLTWLPEKVLTRQQAISAMVLDDIISHPDELDSATMMLVLTELVAELAMPLEQALVRLSFIKKDTKPPRPKRLTHPNPRGSQTVDHLKPILREAK